jgi:hypothetical protein
MIKQVFNSKVFVASLVIASVLLCASLAYILIARPAASGRTLAPALSALTVIPAPTSTPRTLPPTLTPIPPTGEPTPTPAPGQFAVGIYVQISGTGGDGLRIRSDPGLNAAQLFLGYDSEVFLVTKGPEQADGYTWWYLTASYDAARAGWAAQNYLTVIPSP